MSGKWTENIFQPGKLNAGEKRALERRRREEKALRDKEAEAAKKADE